jgi:hypothetical protein
MYKVELLAGARKRPNDQTMAESYVRTALELREMGERLRMTSEIAARAVLRPPPPGHVLGLTSGRG